MFNHVCGGFHLQREEKSHQVLSSRGCLTLTAALSALRGHYTDDTGVNLMTARTGREWITFVISDGEVSFPRGLLSQAEEESVTRQRLVRICGTYSLYPLETETHR